MPVVKRKWRVTPYLFVSAAFLLHLWLVTAPSLYSFFMALCEWNGLGTPRFIGLKNFAEIFTSDKVAIGAIWNCVRWAFYQIFLSNLIGFMVAIWVSKLKKCQMPFRTLFFLPYVIAPAVIGKIWTAYFNPFYGINALFKSLGWIGLSNTLWLGDLVITFYVCMFVSIWANWGFQMVMYMGALQTIDPALYESARVDGATPFQELIHISIPCCYRTIVFMLMMSIIGAFREYDLVNALSQGGPAYASELLAMWIQTNAFENYRAGYASALAIIQFTICFAFYFVQRIATKAGGLEV